jgi:hypothetical protein
MRCVSSDCDSVNSAGHFGQVSPSADRAMAERLTGAVRKARSGTLRRPTLRSVLMISPSEIGPPLGGSACTQQGVHRWKGQG